MSAACLVFGTRVKIWAFWIVIWDKSASRMRTSFLPVSVATLAASAYQRPGSQNLWPRSALVHPFSSANWCPLRCPVTDYSGHMAASFARRHSCKSLILRSVALEERIAKPLYGQKAVPRRACALLGVENFTANFTALGAERAPKPTLGSS